MPVTPPIAPESATTALYRAALGPVNTAQHLPAFERFDAAGRASPVWNWAAGLLTLNWMLFRQLWGAALVYLACAGGVLLLVLGPLRDWWLWPQWPPGVQWGAFGALLLLSIAVPGVWGPALLHADTRRRITRAVREARTVREACAMLETQASTRRRLWGLAALNGLLALAVLAAVLWLRPGAPGTRGGDAMVMPPTQQSAPEATPAAFVAVPDHAVETEPAVAAESPVAEPAREVEVNLASVAPSQTEPESAAPAPAPEVPAVAVSATPATPATPAMAAPKQTPPPATSKPVAAPPRSAAPSAAPADDLPQAHGINVGLFAERANAEKAQARLVEAGLPAILQSTESAKGTPLTRVRVGPLASRAQAEQAAERIRAMGLEAQIFAPGGG
ncbi:SPOR domain-containing protein [Hydrogenophaga palleronii]|uniref:SPOR domain-containing protein n=1 Tax=Hydrogenophaga palleronii TaxID=65655 RepID=UPI00082570FB|nr:SPOR domain-containing protein [Hydrogenophaga palleronii]